METSLPVRVWICPSCKTQHDVSDFDPTDQVTCVRCRRKFVLFRDFSDYRIDYRLNAGGTSIVYLAQQHRSLKKVALKVLRSAFLKTNPATREHFLREAEITHSLKHLNIVEIYDWGEWSGYYFMVMEVLEGFTLDAILTKLQVGRSLRIPQGPEDGDPTLEERFSVGFPEMVALEILHQAASALLLAHEKGYIHGDIKPQNIILTFDGRVKLVDFGLFKRMNQSEPSALSDGAMVIEGSPLYFPPERVRGDPEDFRSDLYGLGATFYHLLRGVAPFRGESAWDLVMKHAHAPLLRFHALVPSASETACRIVEKAMKKTNSGRYSTPVEFIADIQLAKSLLLQNDPMQPTGCDLLVSFMKPYRKKNLLTDRWTKVATNVVDTYHVITRAITSRLKR